MPLEDRCGARHSEAVSMNDRLLVFKGVIEHSGKAVHINNTIYTVLHTLSSFIILVDIHNKYETGQKLYYPLYRR